MNPQLEADERASPSLLSPSNEDRHRTASNLRRPLYALQIQAARLPARPTHPRSVVLGFLPVTTVLRMLGYF